MSTWTLLLVFYTLNGAATITVPGFDSKDSCNLQADLLRSQVPVGGFRDYTREFLAFCVRVK